MNLGMKELMGTRLSLQIRWVDIQQLLVKKENWLKAKIVIIVTFSSAIFCKAPWKFSIFDRTGGEK